MKRLLTERAYEQTRAKLADLERRFQAVESRTGMSELHKSQAIRSYRAMMRQYLRDIKLYEASHSEQAHS